MIGEEFEWDDAKNAANFAKHGVTFERACLIFADGFAVGGYDDRQNYGEERFTIIGMVEGVLLFAAYTENRDRIRIITARRATKQEQNDYYRENSEGA
jgi:hypothetical protein